MVNEQVNSFVLYAAHNCSSVKSSIESMGSVGGG